MFDYKLKIMAKTKFRPRVLTYVNSNYDQRDVYVCNTAEETREAIKKIFDTLEEDDFFSEYQYFDSYKKDLDTRVKLLSELSELKTSRPHMFEDDSFKRFESDKRKDYTEYKRKITYFGYNVQSLKEAREGKHDSMRELLHEALSEHKYIHYHEDFI